MKIAEKIKALGWGGLFILSGCVVPLNVPPKTGSVQAPHIDFARLTELAQASGNAYESDAAIAAAYGQSNVIIRDLPDLDIRYIIVLSSAQHTQTIAIRGTINKPNIGEDINSIKIYDLRLKIFLHLGFKRAADQIYADLSPFLKKGDKIRLTGHSLGGAVACILMMNLLHDGIPVDQVVTFGQPKVTNESGGDGFKTAPYLRVINDQDLVPQLPPSNINYDLSGAYQHFGPEITLLADGKWTYSPVNTPKDFITNDNWKQLDLENAVDHQITNYISRLQAVKVVP